MKGIGRKKTRELIAKARENGRIILLSGLYGVGKTTLLTAISKDLRNERPPVRIVHAGFEREIATSRELIGAAHSLGVGPSALFIDDADLIEDLPTALAEIVGRYATTIFISGRNTVVLERTLQPAFGPSGTNELRAIPVNPFSYAEFLEAIGQGDSRESLSLFCRTGGLPQSLMVPPQGDDAREFTRMRANSFILTEIVESASIRNPSHLRDLLRLVARSTGKSLPSREVQAAFAANRVTISPQAVLDYLSLCADSGLLASIPTFDIARERPLDSMDAWYFGDAGLRYAFVDRDSPTELSRAEENLAYLRLIDDGWSVFRGRVGYGKFLKAEVSFVCEREDNGERRRAYAQVIPSTATAAERLRLRQALLAIRDAWPKYLIDATSRGVDSDGVRGMDMRELLLKGM